jgi:uncharacterized RmlC-like cupin family protein
VTEDRDDAGVPRVLSTADVDGMAWEPLPGMPGVAQKVLWRSGEIVIGLIRVEAGHERPAHVHLAAQHHIWVVAGSCTMLGREVGAGAYVHVPPGVRHAVTEVGPDGCTYFYTHRPLERRPVGEAQVAGAVGAE